MAQPIDPTSFKISFLTGDISTGKLLPSQPLPELTHQEHAQLRSCLLQESIWYQEFGGRAGGKKDRLFTDRISESWEQEREIGVSTGAGEGTVKKRERKKEDEGKRTSVKVEEKALKEFERMIKAISNAALMEFRVGLSLAARDVNLEVRRDIEEVVNAARRAEKEHDVESIATLDVFMPLGFVEVEGVDGSESTVTLDAFEKVEVPAKIRRRSSTSFSLERGMKMFAFMICLLQLFGYVFKITGWLVE